MYYAIDIGGVLCNVNLDKFIDEIDCEDNYSRLVIEGIQAPTEIGLYGFQEALLRYFPSLTNEVDHLLAVYSSVVEPSEKVIGVLEDVLNKGHKVALLSNIGQEHADIIKTFIPTDKCIKHFSYDIGVRKPQKLFYQSFLLQHPEFKGCMYIDDRSENIEAAKKFGLRTKYFRLDDYENDGDAMAAFHSFFA